MLTVFADGLHRRPGVDFADFSFMAPDGDEAASIPHHWPELATPF